MGMTVSHWQAAVDVSYIVSNILVACIVIDSVTFIFWHMPQNHEHPGQEAARALPENMVICLQTVGGCICFKVQ